MQLHLGATRNTFNELVISTQQRLMLDGLVYMPQPFPVPSLTVGSLIGRRAMWVLHNGMWKVLDWRWELPWLPLLAKWFGRQWE